MAFALACEKLLSKCRRGVDHVELGHARVQRIAFVREVDHDHLFDVRIATQAF